jgi:alkanesulfonate monooxygenase SsuD/methylene tetrahydromethanopterin reductase-like flavin-dependent oxidoreductase (luciferase family)
LAVRFGYGLITCQRYPGDPRGDADLYREALGAAELAERLGFDSVWTSEHHFADDSYAPSLLTLSAALAARTSRVQIGTGLLLAPLYHPIRLAEDAAVVDLISGGRFVLGLGQGWLGWEFEALGVTLGQRVRRLRAAIETCRQAWGNGLVEPAGVAVSPKPARPGGPPIWVGAVSEPAIRRAAALADGWMAAEPDPGTFRTQLQWLRDEMSKRGRRPEEFGVAGYWPVFAWDEPGRAWPTVRPFHHYVQWKYQDAERAKGRLGPLPLPPALDQSSEAALRNEIICGTPAEVASRIAGLAELARVAGPHFTFIARLHYPGMDPAIVRAAARLFAEDVIPAVRARVGGND